jgi:hypothetical protein
LARASKVGLGNQLPDQSLHHCKNRSHQPDHHHLPPKQCLIDHRIHIRRKIPPVLAIVDPRRQKLANAVRRNGRHHGRRRNRRLRKLRRTHRDRYGGKLSFLSPFGACRSEAVHKNYLVSEERGDRLSRKPQC